MPCLVVCALEGAGQSVCPKEGLGLCFCATPSNMLSPLQCLSLPVHSGLWGKCVPHPPPPGYKADLSTNYSSFLPRNAINALPHSSPPLTKGGGVY